MRRDKSSGNRSSRTTMVFKAEGGLKTLSRVIRSWLKEIWSYGTGKAGLVLLAFFIFMAILALITLPPDYRYIWNQPKYWQDYPQLAPPSWVRLLGEEKAEHRIYVFTKPTRVTTDSFRIFKYTAYYNLDVNDYPQDIVVKLIKVRVPHTGPTSAPIILRVNVRRPDGVELKVVDTTLYLSSNATYAYVKEPLMMGIDRNLVVSEVSLKLLKGSTQTALNPVIAINYVFSKL
ncbi:MAG TPA: hypothetical protein ENF75_02480, partial [Acidilobales archaeon]|nr:hypothetical protein [Acidilobales archaeon]